MWGISIPNSSHRKPEQGEQLPLAFDIPVPAQAREAETRRRSRRQPPSRTCGQCGRSFKAWREDGLCGRCEEDGSPREKVVASAQNAPATCEQCGHVGADVIFGLCDDCGGPAAA